MRNFGYFSKSRWKYVMNQICVVIEWFCFTEDTLKVFLSSGQWNGLNVGVESFWSIVLSFWLCGDEFKQPNNSPKNVLRIPAQLKSAARWFNTTCHFLSFRYSSMSIYTIWLCKFWTWTFCESADLLHRIFHTINILEKFNRVGV